MIYPDALTVHYKGSELYVVPSMHFNHVFSREVNRICSHINMHPEAIAVELGTNTVLTARNWLRELVAGPGTRKELPVMLGIMKQNRMLRASLKQKAFQLQKETGKDLSELSPEILYRELGFSLYSVLFLSPVDSIIEAMRCGIELGIPVFGIDLEEMADSIFKPIYVQDPIMAQNNFSEYISQNAPLAEEQRDEEIDHRREIAMAARLKGLLQEYRRVLFVCGMAHWMNIKRLLDDSSIRPSVIQDIQQKEYGDLKRVVVHPVIAVKYMDLFPAMAAVYEKQRMPAGIFLKPGNKKGYIEPAKVFYNTLKRAYKYHFIRKDQKCQPLNWGHDLENIQKFEMYLGNVCMLNNLIVPDIFMTTKSAQEIMSSEFVQTLTKVFMKFPWASPKHFPDCDVLSPTTDTDNEPDRTVLIKNGLQGREYFYIQSVHKNNTTPIEIPYEWEKTNHLQKKWEFAPTGYTWLPWDRLITSMSLRADKHATKKPVNESVIFEGSLLNGIDIKSTIRSLSRGRDNIYVWDYSKENLSRDNPVEGFPVVWLLGPNEHKGLDWVVLQEPGSYMEKYIKDKKYFNKVLKERGNKMVATIGYGNRSFKSYKSGKSYIKADKYKGIIIFQPIGWTNRQFARWAELNQYRSNPFYNDSFFDQGFPGDLADYYKKNHCIIIGAYSWSTTLILLALPFAKDTLTVVAPDNYKIESLVYKVAKRYRVEVNKAPLNLFSDAEVERLSLCHLVPAITIEPQCRYSKDVERAIGESQTDNLHLVPKLWQDFGNDPY